MLCGERGLLSHPLRPAELSGDAPSASMCVVPTVRGAFVLNHDAEPYVYFDKRRYWRHKAVFPLSYGSMF